MRRSFLCSHILKCYFIYLLQIYYLRVSFEPCAGVDLPTGGAIATGTLLNGFVDKEKQKS